MNQLTGRHRAQGTKGPKYLPRSLPYVLVSLPLPNSDQVRKVCKQRKTITKMKNKKEASQMSSSVVVLHADGMEEKLSYHKSLTILNSTVVFDIQ